MAPVAIVSSWIAAAGRTALAVSSWHVAMSVPLGAQLLDGNLLRIHPDYGLYTSHDGDTRVWPPGVYSIGADLNACFVLHPAAPPPPPPPAAALTRGPRQDLTIDATGVTIIVDDPETPVFRFIGCKGIVIKGLTIDYAKVPFNQSRITGINVANDMFTVQLDPGYPGFEDPQFDYGTAEEQTKPQQYGALYDPNFPRLKSGTSSDFMHLDAFVKDPDGLPSGCGYYILISNPAFHDYLTHFAVGDRFVYFTNRLGVNLFDVRYCEPTATNPCFTLDGVTALSGAHNFAILRQTPNVANTGQAVIRNCVVTPGPAPSFAGSACVAPCGPQTTPPCNPRLITLANPVFSEDCRVGPLIENCMFEQLSDDGMDLHGRARLFIGYRALSGPQPPPPYSVARFGPGVRLAVGDTLQIFNPATGSAVLRTIVGLDSTNLETAEDERIVYLNASTPGMAGDGVSFTSTHAFNMNAASAYFVVRNNTIRNARGHGAVLYGPGGLFEGNTIEWAGQGGVGLANIASFGGLYGPVPMFITVRNNTLRHCGFTDLTSFNVSSASILAGALKGYPNGGSASVQSATDLIIEANTIENWTRHGIFAVGLKNSKIRANVQSGIPNRFIGVVPNPYRAITVAAPAGTTNVIGVDATQASGLDYAVRIENGVDSSVIVSAIQVTPPTLPLEDLR